jgi:hypothetical protein
MPNKEAMGLDTDPLVGEQPSWPPGGSEGANRQSALDRRPHFNDHVRFDGSANFQPVPLALPTLSGNAAFVQVQSLIHSEGMPVLAMRFLAVVRAFLESHRYSWQRFHFLSPFWIKLAMFIEALSRNHCGPVLFEATDQHPDGLSSFDRIHKFVGQCWR